MCDCLEKKAKELKEQMGPENAYVCGDLGGSMFSLKCKIKFKHLDY